ncbi:unnamed protein product [Timema podura]|uniref:Uncharacterized protein n=1 Tax=Timema podura TaxID=61482 RepID=A0ABN7PC41_TIMPD|nr:unnamed protein product [Timema podura]
MLNVSQLNASLRALIWQIKTMSGDLPKIPTTTQKQRRGTRKLKKTVKN